MIEVIGEAGSSEYNAALSIAKAIGHLWPGLETSASSIEHVRIASNVKISGYRVSDIDVVVCGVFNRERRFIPKKIVKDNENKRVVRKPITVDNFIAVIEVKDHDEDAVQITGDNISVKYSRGAKTGWSSATDQNINQLHALQHYFKDLGHQVYIHRSVVMQGLGAINIGGALSSNYDGIDFFTALSSVSRVRKTLKGYILSSGSSADFPSILNAPIFNIITPTALDRKRMDMLVTSTPESNHLYSCLGKKMVQLRGHGGTGKTVMCLQMAWKAFDEQGLRTLVLTYNHALAADIRRLLALLHIPSNPHEGGIVVETVMSFMYSWFLELQVLEKTEEFSYENYDTNCRETLELLDAGAITKRDISNIIENNTDRYDYDSIFVDEAQDWPQGEVDLLKTLYEPKSICIADGIDQLIRGERPNWLRDVNDYELISLNRCLRMKRNLAVFVNEVAEVSNTKWNVSPNDVAGGGKIIILLKPYHECQSLHGKLLDTAKNKGNAEIDFLFCVPSTSVKLEGKSKVSDIGNYLTRLDYEVWDGVDETVRKDFPRSKNQFRVVQYASCRGLEGWTVILNNADHFWVQCNRAKYEQGLLKEEELAFEDIAEASARQAWHQMLIAMTRPIDTLVISLDDLNSDISIVLLKVAKKYSEFVEIVR